MLTLFYSADVVWDNTEQSAWHNWKQGQVCPFPTGRGMAEFQVINDVPIILTGLFISKTITIDSL